MAEVSTRNDVPQRFLCDRRYRNGDRRGILMFGGGGYLVDTFAQAGTNELDRTRVLLNEGYPTASCSGDWLWGNSTMRSRISALKTAAQVSLFATGKVHIFGTSMGGLHALNFAKYNPTLVQSISMILPAVDVQDIYDNDRNGYATGADSIDTAYGGRPADADNPADNTATLSAIPQQVMYSTTDNICVPEVVVPYAEAVGAEIISLGNVGHILAGIDNDDITRFFNEND